MMEGKDKLPKGWAKTSLAEIGVWTSGGTPSRKHPEYYGGDIPWIKTGELADKMIIKADEHITKQGLLNSSAKLFPEGTLLLAMYGATIGQLGILGMPATTNQACAALLAEGITKDLIPYIFYYLKSVRNELKSNGQGGAQPNINQSIIRNFPIRIPPLKEQKRIVAKIKELRAHSRRVREALETIPDLLEKLRQSTLAAAFRGDLTKKWRNQNKGKIEPATELLKRIRTERRKRWEESELEKLKAKGLTGDKLDEAFNNRRKQYKEPVSVDTTDLPDLPEGWCWASWSEVGFCQNGRAFPSKYYSKEGVKLLRPGNLHVFGRIEWTSENTRRLPIEWKYQYKEYIIGPGELVINLTAQSLKDEFLGRVCLTGQGENCLLNQRIARLSPITLSSAFCLWLLKSPVFRRFVDKLNTGSLIQHIFTTQIDEFVFALPPLKEQELIVQEIERFIRVKERLEQSLLLSTARIGNLNQSLLTKAFHGELVPQDPNDEPASVLLERIRQEKIPQVPKPKTKGKHRVTKFKAQKSANLHAIAGQDKAGRSVI